MRQQFSWFFAAFFIALFSTFFLVAHTHPQDLSEIEHTSTEQHASALLNNSVVEPFALLKAILPYIADLDHAKKVCKYDVEPLWFSTLFRPLTVLTIQHQYNLNSLYKHQQNVVADISELIWLILGIAVPLYVDTSAQRHFL